MVSDWFKIVLEHMNVTIVADFVGEFSLDSFSAFRNV